MRRLTLIARREYLAYVRTVGLRPGTMSTALGLKPVMTFVPTGEADKREFVAAFRQNSLQRLEKGEDPERLEEEFGDSFANFEEEFGEETAAAVGLRPRRTAPVRDPKLYEMGEYI